jgi:multisubunit Na+/H+ antiporter MnhE subunit
MTQNVTNIGKVVACAVLFLLLRFVAEFSYARSVDLAALLALLLFWRMFQAPHFDSYCVRIRPNWYQLLLHICFPLRFRKDLIPTVL